MVMAKVAFLKVEGWVVVTKDVRKGGSGSVTLSLS